MCPAASGATTSCARCTRRFIHRLSGNILACHAAPHIDASRRSFTIILRSDRNVARYCESNASLIYGGYSPVLRANNQFSYI